MNLTVIVCVIALLLHKFPVAEDEVKVVEPPTQNELLPVIVGKANDVTITTLEVSEIQVPDVTQTE